MARQNARDQVMIGFGSHLICIRLYRNISKSIAKQNQTNFGLVLTINRKTTIML